MPVFWGAGQRRGRGRERVRRGARQHTSIKPCAASPWRCSAESAVRSDGVRNPAASRSSHIKRQCRLGKRRIKRARRGCDRAWRARRPAGDLLAFVRSSTGRAARSRSPMPSRPGRRSGETSCVCAPSCAEPDERADVAARPGGDAHPYIEAPQSHQTLIATNSGCINSHNLRTHGVCERNGE